MINAEKLDTASSAFFFCGFLISQLQRSPIPLMAALANIAAISLYSIAYGLWLIACHVYPDYPRKRENWYGFIEVKNQQKIAAVIGIIAIPFSILGIFFPLMLIAASWLFFASNLIWCISEYHKQQYQFRNDPSYSAILQSTYTQYTVLTAIISLLPAAAATIALFFPPAALLSFFFSAALGTCLSSIALYCWLDHKFNGNPTEIAGSYNTLANNFSITTIGNELDVQPAQQAIITPNPRSPSSHSLIEPPVTIPSSYSSITP